MANEAELFGLPGVQIDFKTKGTTAIKRSARGIVAIILHDGATDVMTHYKIDEVTDVPTTLTEDNQALIRMCLKGTPLRIQLYTIPETPKSAAEGATQTTVTNTQATVLPILHNVKWNYICAPTATGTEQDDLVSWVKSERTNKRKTFKAVVANQKADHEGIINFCTEDIKVETSTDTSGNPVYTVYTALQYTARIAGILAGLALDRSATYFLLTEVESCHVYEDLPQDAVFPDQGSAAPTRFPLPDSPFPADHAWLPGTNRTAIPAPPPPAAAWPESATAPNSAY